MAGLRTIEISGASALDRGVQHGQAAADLIAEAITYYARAFEHQIGSTWAEVLELAQPWQQLIADEFPELCEEMTGIAYGAGVSLAEIVALNCRGEIVYDRGFSQAGPDDETDGCTSFSLTGAAGGDGHVYCGQNWDWRHGVAHTVVILRIEQPPKPTVIMQVEAGQIGRHGANSHGLALNANGLGGRFDDSVGIPQTVIRRLVLDSPTISDALRVLVSTKAHIASNTLLTHRDGFAIDLEATPGPIGWEYPTNGLLVHGNHYQAFVPPQLAAAYRPMSADSLLRVPRAGQGLAAAAATEKSDDVRTAIHTAMSDHLGFPESLCAHPDERLPEVMRWSTLLSSCVDLTTGDYYVAPGMPCRNPYELLPFNLYK